MCLTAGKLWKKTKKDEKGENRIMEENKLLTYLKRGRSNVI